MLEVNITKLLDDIVVVGAFHYIKQAHYIFRVNRLHDFDFGNKGCFQIGVGVDWDMGILTT